MATTKTGGRRAGADETRTAAARAEARRRPAPAPTARRRRPAAAPDAMTAERLRALCAPHGEELYRLASDGHRLLARHRRDVVRVRYALGRNVAAACRRHADAAALPVLAAAWCVSVKRVREFRRMAEAYEPAEVAAFLELRTPAGMPLSWSHFEFAGDVKDWGLRARLLADAAARGLVANDFRVAIQAAGAGVEGTGAGPGRRRPSLYGVLRGLDARADALLALATPELAAGLVRLADAVPSRAAAAARRAQLDAALGRLADLPARAGAMVAALAAARARLDERAAGAASRSDRP